MRLLAAIMIALAIGAIYLTPAPVRISGDDIAPLRVERPASRVVSTSATAIPVCIGNTQISPSQITCTSAPTGAATTITYSNAR